MKFSVLSLRVRVLKSQPRQFGWRQLTELSSRLWPEVPQLDANEFAIRIDFSSSLCLQQLYGFSGKDD